MNIMVLEDEALIALDIQRTLERAEMGSVTICHSVDAAMLNISHNLPDISFLDFNLGAKSTSIPVAERLLELRAPFAFLTSYTPWTCLFPDIFSDIPRISKPFREAQIIIMARRLSNSPLK